MSTPETRNSAPPDVPAVDVDDLLHHAEAEPVAVRGGRVARLEHFLAVAGRDAGPVVGDVEPVVGGADGHVDGVRTAPLRTTGGVVHRRPVFQCVAEQDLEEPPEL